MSSAGTSKSPGAICHSGSLSNRPPGIGGIAVNIASHLFSNPTSHSRLFPKKLIRGNSIFMAHMNSVEFLT